MPTEIPCTSAGSRKFIIDAGPEYLSLRTYYSIGMEPVWFLDIESLDGTPLAVGLPILPGSANLLRGQGDRLDGYCIQAVLLDGEQGDPEGLGDKLRLLFWGQEEEKPEVRR